MCNEDSEWSTGVGHMARWVNEHDNHTPQSSSIYYSTQHRCGPFTIVYCMFSFLGIYLNEHRDQGGWGGGHTRRIVITLQGQS